MSKEIVIDLEGVGEVLVPSEFVPLIPSKSRIKVIDASYRADNLLQDLSQGWLVVVSTGEYSSLRVLLWYIMRFRYKLLPPWDVKPDPVESRRRQDAIRNKINRLMVAVRAERIVGIQDPPDLEGLADWAAWPVRSDHTYLVPMRRLSRILTDMRRSREGMEIKALDAKIVVMPHVYIPFDQSVIDLVADNLVVEPDETVLDLGTGTGVLAFVAARKEPKQVVATDILDNAVKNTRLNAERLDLGRIVDVREAGDLFDPVQEERFDVIIFNPPWILGDAKTLYDHAIYDAGQGTATRFIQQAGSHLTGKGRIYLLYSDISESTGERSISKLKEMIEESGLYIASDWVTSRRSRVLGHREVVHLFNILPKAPQA